MNGSGLTSSEEMAEINRIHYELEYTEGISQRMRIPEKLQIAPAASDDQEGTPLEAHHSVLMQVPERILVAGDSDETQYPRPRDLDLIQSTPLETLALKTPPRVLTLSERPLDFLEMEQSAGPAQPIEEGRAQVRLRRERSASENTSIRQNGQLSRNDPLEVWMGLYLFVNFFILPVVLAAMLLCSVTPPIRAPLCTDPVEAGILCSTRGVLSMIQSTTRRAYQQVLEVLDENRCSKPVLRGGSSNPPQDSRFGLSALDTSQDGAPDDMAVVDAASLRRQILKLNRRLQLLEEENKERTKREMIMYSITVAFWIVNSWIWFRR